jgi:flagellin FlaB
LKAALIDLLKKPLKQSRGIVGIEAAILLIAFVVIAAAMAYVVINMGFYAGQKAKSTIDQGVSEATGALEQDGFVTGLTNGTVVQYLAIPVKLAVGGGDEDLNGSNVVVSVLCTQVVGTTWSLANVYLNTTPSSNSNLTALMTGLPATSSVAWQFNSEGDTVLNQNEKAYFCINLGPNYQLLAYSKVKIEIRTGKGAALLIMRDIPGGLPNNGAVDLG